MPTTMMMMIQTQVGTPPDFSTLTGVVGFGRAFGARTPDGDGADEPSVRGMVITRFVGSAGGAGGGEEAGGGDGGDGGDGVGGVGTVTDSTRGADGVMPPTTPSVADVDGGVEVAEGCEGAATAAGSDRGALAIGAAVKSTAATLGTAGAGVCAPDLGGGCATSA